MKKFHILLELTFAMSWLKITMRNVIFFFDDSILLFRLCWLGPYPQEEGDYKYCWLNKYNGEGIHFS